MQSLLLLLPLLVLGARAQPCYTEIYNGTGQTGEYELVDYDGISHLSDIGMDDAIQSVLQTGMWLYHENDEFNRNNSGITYYVHGIDIDVTFPEEYQNIMSSLRCAGCETTLNEEAIMFFEDTMFSGFYMYLTINYSVLRAGYTTSSIIVTGPSPWTVCTSEGNTASSWCLEATEHDVGTNGSILDLGIYPSVEEIGIPDSSIHSVSKGCYADRVAEAPNLQVDGRQENGAWGRLV